MKNTKNYLFLSIAVIISLAITSCGKYEDGPGFSLLSKTARMTNKWELKSVDGETIPAGDLVLDLKKDGSMSINEDGYIIDGSWEFSSDKEDLRLSIFGDEVDLKIRRLTNKELWLENELEDNELSKFEAQ
ncbi:MAG: hypothetical protein NTY55_07830 [Flavobacteriia bacterium]|jgi:hypothetical protein|nr:hypothetical protein [Flavobacteriia bacterium]